MRKKETDIETIIGRVNGSMAIEGMLLSNEDKARIRRYGGNPATLQTIRRELLEKHTVRIGVKHEHRI